MDYFSQIEIFTLTYYVVFKRKILNVLVTVSVMKKHLSVLLFMMFFMTSLSAYSDSSKHNTYWIQVFAAKDKHSIDRFISIHPKISWKNAIEEDNLYKVVIGPFASFSLAKIGLSECRQFDDAFIKNYYPNSGIDYHKNLAKLTETASDRTQFQLMHLPRR